jgi:NAD(P)-dependent dehydrogenase (short-subunit alcohol dehydrogenase family)
VQDAIATLGAIDVLVNNAAVFISHPLAETSYVDWQAAWRESIEVNLFGAANVSYCVARHMIEQGQGGRIVNVGSRGAYRGEPNHPAYGASKAALHSLGQSLAVHLAPHGIAVASVAPGFVHTERQSDLLDSPRGEAIRTQSPFGRVGTVEEVAAAVVYLASPDAVWASGAVLDLNGASYLH